MPGPSRSEEELWWEKRGREKREREMRERERRERGKREREQRERERREEQEGREREEREREERERERRERERRENCLFETYSLNLPSYRNYRLTKSTAADRPWIDIDRIRRWIDICDRTHRDHCRGMPPLEGLDGGRPLWLVDVQRNCVKRACPDDGYVALSYVWGVAPCEGQLEASLSNIEQLQEDGYLVSDLIGKRLPPTVRHAIRFIELIGQRYIWIDRLCIVQDDVATKASQISNMAYIYANAVFTIAATVGDRAGASYGLRGIKGICPPKTGKEEDALIRSTGVKEEKHHELVARSYWSRRGWTLQELVFSPRAIFFHDHTVTWECHCAVWKESDAPEILLQPQSQCLATLSLSAKGLKFPPWPDLEQYAQLVVDYNGRELSYESDVEPAFAGITTALSTVFSGGFVYGLPEMFFDVALLWEGDGTEVRRHQFSTQNQTHGQAASQAAFPSWSWMGWRTEYLNLNAWESGYDYILKKHRASTRVSEWKQTPVRTESILQWYVGGKDIKTHRPINACLGIYSDCRDNLSCSLPAGWTREDECFRHTCDPQTSFRFPIAIKDPKITPKFQVGGPFLSCNTTRGWFEVRCGSGWYKDLAFPIYGSKGDLAGSLATYGVDVNKDRRPLLMREFIAISAGSIQIEGDIWEGRRRVKRLRRRVKRLHHADLPGDGKPYEYVNVLWIQWEDGIAYRRGIGHVVKSIWEQQATDVIDLILG